MDCFSIEVSQKYKRAKVWITSTKCLLFRGAFVDAYCGIEDASGTRKYTLYVEMVKYLYQKREHIGWSEKDQEEIKSRTLNFKAERKNRFWATRFCYCNKESQALDHFPDTSEKLGDTRLGYGRVFEAPHEPLNQSYRKRFWRRRSVMYVVVSGKLRSWTLTGGFQSVAQAFSG